MSASSQMLWTQRCSPLAPGLPLVTQARVMHSLSSCVPLACPTNPPGVVLPCAVLSYGAVTVVIISRLVYRKGINLAAAVVVDACRRCPRLRFLIGDSIAGGLGACHLQPSSSCM